MLRALIFNEEKCKQVLSSFVNEEELFEFLTEICALWMNLKVLSEQKCDAKLSCLQQIYYVAFFLQQNRESLISLMRNVEVDIECREEDK